MVVTCKPQTDMKCDFDICEFYNVFIGGIITGIITSVLFVYLTNFRNSLRFKKLYGHLQSDTDQTYDWTSYSMKKEDGRIRQESPNGSTLSIRLKSDRLQLLLKQTDTENWSGELLFTGVDHGVVTYKYKSRHEYGQRNCFIGSFEEEGQIFDYLFLSPINNKIYYIEKIDANKEKAVYNYDDEVYIRKRASR